MSDVKKYAAPALEKGLDILEYLSSKTEPLSQADIAAGIGKSPNEIYRVLVGLEARRYIVRSEISGKYRLSLKLYSLAHTHSPVERLREAAALPLRELAEAVGQSCHLSLLYEGRLMVVSQMRSSEPVSLSITEGTLFPLLSTASGRVMLANMSKEMRQDIMQSDEVYSQTSLEQRELLEVQLQKILEDRFYMGVSEITVGVTDCAAFVGQVEGGLFAAVAVSGLTSSISTKRREVDITSAVRFAADSISTRMGL
ncbi:IclR family transcriptional regulator [Hirschia litorea]|uniref:IclR family transcriptional regulator n=1 Tax=Hirschia litorea TaxID=1199156 RepID=A0ABW2IP59_9PROT